MSAEMHAMVGAYALDALDHREQMAFESHLASCPSCADELLGFRATAERLGAAVALSAPPRLRESVLAVAASTPQERRVVALRRGDRWRRRMPVLVAAASVLAVVSLFGVYLGEHNRFERDQVAQSQEAAVRAADDTSTASARVRGDTQVKVIASPSMNSAVVELHQVPPLEPGTSYQMWAVSDKGGARSLGVMSADEVTDPTIRVVKGINSADMVALTVEPEGGSQQPTSQPVISVDLA